MKVRRLPIDPGPAGWAHLLPERVPAPALAGRETADWLVIGAGFAGLAAAHRLAQLNPGDRIVLIEATTVGSGPAGRNSGFMIDLPHDLASEDYGGALESDQSQTRANRHAIEYAARMAAEFDLPAEAFQRSGKINAAAGARGHGHNLDYARHLEAMGEGFELLDQAQMRAITGTAYYQSGLFTPGTAMVQPAMFVRGIAGGLVSNRVRLFENSPVTGLRRQGGDWIASTSSGQVTAPRVILAVNGHIESFGHFTGRLLHVFTYASMTRTLTGDEVRALGGEPVWGVTPADPMGTTVRKTSGTGGDRIVIRNRFTCDPSMTITKARLRRVGRDHDSAFMRRFPMLREVPMEYRWGGRLCLSRNNVPAFGALDEGLFSACCQNGLGTVKGTLSGLLAAELASGQPSEFLTEFQEQPAPSRLPPRPLTWLGANAVMRWHEHRAGRDL